MVAVVTSVTVVGIRETIVALDAEMTGYTRRVTAGLIAAGHVVEARAKHNVAPYKYRTPSRLKEAITTWVSVRALGYVSVHVGIRGNTFAPEGKTFEVNWRSARGLQPPSAPIEQWLISRGIATGSKARSGAWAIARAQGRRGYSFGERHWLSDAWAQAQPEALAIVERYAESFWAGQNRVAAGVPTGGRFLPGGE